MDPTNPYAAPTVDAYFELESKRPQTFPEIIAGGTNLYVSRFPAVLAITALIWIPGELLHSYIEYFGYALQRTPSKTFAKDAARICDPPRDGASFLAAFQEGRVVLVRSRRAVLPRGRRGRQSNLVWFWIGTYAE